MMHHRPIQERDVIFVYLLGDTQTFLKRIQIYLGTKQKLLGLPPESLPPHQTQVEHEVRANPNDILKRLELAVFYEIQDELSEATGQLDSVIQLLCQRDEDCSDLYVLLGSLYERQGEYDKAYKEYEEGKDWGLKLRPAVCLRALPPTYNEFLVCGLSTQVNNRYVKDFDEIVFNRNTNGDNLVNLPAPQSVIRLGFLDRVRKDEIVGRIGSISVARHRRLLKKLGEYLVNSKHRV